jgi:tetratricopeptide (TPR) repeat protein
MSENPNKLIKLWQELKRRRDNSWSEAAIAYNLGELFSEAGNLEKAKEYHRQELSLEPDNAFRIYNLAWFLIDKDQNINEG